MGLGVIRYEEKWDGSRLEIERGDKDVRKRNRKKESKDRRPKDLLAG